jgi:hypothetical protein
MLPAMAEFEHAQNLSPARVEAAATPRTAKAEPHELLRLQRLAGNAAVSSLIAQRQGDAGGGGGGGGQTFTVSSISLRKAGVITVALSNGTVTDASATVG